jgi:hypothetical protein
VTSGAEGEGVAPPVRQPTGSNVAFLIEEDRPLLNFSSERTVPFLN